MTKFCQFFTLLIVFSSFTQIFAPSEHQARENAVKALISRLIGEEISTLFNVTISNSTQHKDVVTLLKKDDLIHIAASSGVAAAYGFHHYLKYYCKCHISWDSDQLQMPLILPEVNLKLKSMDKFRYYQNVVTYSYSFVWWTWERWEREIDWMALNGINLALAFTGQEAIWLNVFKHFNMTYNEINEHFTGSAFLAWNRMGNMRGWGGPLSKIWHRNSLDLQHKILARMNELGIIPILPAFCGHLPRAFQKLFPNVKMRMLPSWAHFEDEYCCPYLLDPEETLFHDIGKMFMQELVKQFGATHYYNCDTFNEMTNPFDEVKSLANFSSAVFNAMVKTDVNATWILQGWLFADNETFWTKEKAKEYLSGVPNDRMIILDLQSETAPQYTRLDSYFGKPFIWCMLHNFGGNLGMHGSFDIINQKIIEARNMKKSTMIGTGITPEGINQNYVIYDFMAESSWRDAPVDTDLWVTKYTERRYGINNIVVKTAWILLRNSVYNYNRPERLHGYYVLCKRPSLKLTPLIWYDVNDVLAAWDLLVNATNVINMDDVSDNYYHDLVDISRQSLQLGFDKVYENLIASYSKNDVLAFEKFAKMLLSILEDLDNILSTSSHFMLGPWLHDARTFASSHLENQSFDFYAKNQITLWGPKGENLDYATKQWSGVVIDYYYPRWKLFCHYLSLCLRTRNKFDEKKFNNHVFRSVEDPFCRSTKIYPIQPKNDTLFVVKDVYRKWRSLIQALDHLHL